MRPLIAAGAAVGPVMYLLDLLGTVATPGTWQLDSRLGWIPVAGPMIVIAGGWRSPQPDSTGIVMTGVVTGLQILAAASTIVGLSLWQPHLRRQFQPPPAVTLSVQGTSLSLGMSF